MSNKEELLKLLISDNIPQDTTKWFEMCEYRLKNKKWLNQSQKIAITILQKLEDYDMSYDTFAKNIESDIDTVQEMVKGKYNFTIKEISLIETTFNIDKL